MISPKILSTNNENLKQKKSQNLDLYEIHKIHIPPSSSQWYFSSETIQTKQLKALRKWRNSKSHGHDDDDDDYFLSE